MQLHDRRESVFRVKEDKNKTEGGEVICWMEGWVLNAIVYLNFVLLNRYLREITTAKILLLLNYDY